MNPVDRYIAGAPAAVRAELTRLRATILKAAPGAVEGFGYGMPAYKVNGKPLVYFSVFKNHFGLYATPTAHSEFADALSQYKHGKGSVQFPIDEPIPLGLVRRIVRFKYRECLATGKKRSRKRIR